MKPWMYINSSILLSFCSFDSEGTSDCVDEDRGSLAVQSSLEPMPEVGAIVEYAGGASEYGDRLLSLPPCRGGSGGGVPIGLLDLVVVAIVADPLLV